MAKQASDVIEFISNALGKELNWNGLNYEFVSRGVAVPEKKLFCECIANCLFSNLKNGFCQGSLRSCEAVVSDDDLKIKIVHRQPQFDYPDVIVPIYFVIYTFYGDCVFKWHGISLWSDITKKYYSDMSHGDTYLSFNEAGKELQIFEFLR